MYISEKDRKRLLPEIAKLDLVSQGEMESAVNSYARVTLRIEHVAKVVANLREEFRGVEKYEWYVGDWRIDLRDHEKSMTHLNEMTVTVDLHASRKGEGDEHEDRLATMYRGGSIDDGRDIIKRRVEFPRRYLLTDDWIEEAKAKAAASRMWWLKRWIEELPEGIRKLEEQVEETRQKLNDYRTELQELRDKGYRATGEKAKEDEETV